MIPLELFIFGNFVASIWLGGYVNDAAAAARRPRSVANFFVGFGLWWAGAVAARLIAWAILS